MVDPQHCLLPYHYPKASLHTVSKQVLLVEIYRLLSCREMLHCHKLNTVLVAQHCLPETVQGVGVVPHEEPSP